MAENFFGITDIGKVRKNNEDTFIAEPVCKGQLIAACVIDGVGGYSGGELAARLAREAIIDHLNIISNDIINIMKSALSFANEKIYKEKQLSKQNEQMACVVTLALADVNNNKFYYAHVGDTRLYLLRDKTLVKVTRDHSIVGFLEESGRLSEEAAMNHPKRNEINKALGFEAQIGVKNDFIETGESPFLPGDTILLCSDGLSDMIGSSEITSILNTDNSLAAKSKALIDAANDAGGTDNITVVLVHNNKFPLQQIATKPAAALKKNEGEKSEEDVKEKAGFAKKILDKHKRSSNKSNKLVPVLVFFCILFLFGFLWLLLKGTSTIKEEQKEKVQSAGFRNTRNEGEQRLLNNINDTLNNNVVNLRISGGHPIVISDSINIRKDSLLIIGNGATLFRDSAYTGPALILSPQCSYILLDSIIIENFDVAILVHNKSLHLKNVQFKNCRVP
ncbi:MAG: serine/threonine-protein phosphatase, partial [Chitinophagaceae bacterium]|nr:serine/threonine-protein phosphatase [Chitinophagaceae bacterium]